jgi:hypothetical protein
VLSFVAQRDNASIWKQSQLPQEIPISTLSFNQQRDAPALNCGGAEYRFREPRLSHLLFEGNTRPSHVQDRANVPSELIRWALDVLVSARVGGT